MTANYFITPGNKQIGKASGHTIEFFGAKGEYYESKTFDNAIISNPQEAVGGDVSNCGRLTTAPLANYEQDNYIVI